MMQRRMLLRYLPFVAVGVAFVSNSGCALVPNIIQSIRGEKIKPECEALKNKKVVIICGGERGINNDTSSVLLAHLLEERLSQNVEGIKIVPREKVDKWLSEIGRDEPDFQAIGKGVGADCVLAVTLANLSLRNGQTLFKGKADISVTVYDIKQESITYRKNMPEFEFPKFDGPSIADTNETKFRNIFLKIVSQHIGVLFYPHDPKELAAQDPIALRS